MAAIRPLQPWPEPEHRRLPLLADFRAFTAEGFYNKIKPAGPEIGYPAHFKQAMGPEPGQTPAAQQSSWSHLPVDGQQLGWQCRVWWPRGAFKTAGTAHLLPAF